MNKEAKVFYITTIGCIVVVILLLIWGNVQNTFYEVDGRKLKEANQYLDTNPNLSLQILQNLDYKYPNNYYLFQMLGDANAIVGDYEKAAIYMQNALDTQQLLLLNPIFDLKYGQISLVMKDVGKAKLLLEKAKELNTEEANAPLIDELLREADKK